MGGLGLDLLILALLVAAIVVLYVLRPEPAPALLAAGGPPPAEGWTGRFATYPSRLLRHCGLRPEAGIWIYWLAKLALGLLLPFLLLEIPWLRSSGAVWWFLLGALVGFFLPDLFLLGIRRRRRRRIGSALSYFLDLIAAFLQSGLTLDECFRRAGRDGFEADHPLSEEVALVARELDAGKDPSEAFQSLADRTGVEDFWAVASSLRVGMRLGTPVGETIAIQADLLWAKRREYALKRINTASAKAVFAVVMCGFPIFFVLVFFPAILEMIEVVSAYFPVWR